MSDATTLSLNGARKAITRAHLKHWVDERCPEWMPDNSLDRQIALARKEMGDARWNELNKEWTDG